ncbi:MAG TPA: galactose-1-phosphate uridylyltransferase [Nitrospiria bacterium]|nr:galactose-1-phosphate uridylyltransferase [Nitrospiria bacterium]
MPELRKDPIVGRWVIIATERGKRSNDYRPAAPAAGVEPRFCAFCSGNEDKTPPEILAYRPEGSKPNSPGWRVRVIPNKFPALRIEGGLNREGEGIYDKMNGVGAHEVIIESPDHKQTLATLTAKQVEDVLWSFRDRTLDLKRDKRFRFILLFKNYGESAGASVEHSHSQLIALPIVPRNVIEELRGAKEYYDFKERCIFCDIIRQELASKVRLVSENDQYVCIAPYAARFPFENWILPKIHNPYFEDPQKNDFEALSRILGDALKRQNKALNTPPYNFIIHSAPFNQSYHDEDYYHWHMEIMPRLTHLAGFERGTGFYINPTPPEEAAKFLRELDLEE